MCKLKKAVTTEECQRNFYLEPVNDLSSNNSLNVSNTLNLLLQIPATWKS